MSFFVRFRAASLRALAAGVLTAGLALAPGSSVFAATQWKALVGTNTADHAIQGNAFFPGEISIHVGDTITWNANSGEIHTVTFEDGPPPPGLSGFDVVATPAGGSSFGGSGWFNSGVMSTTPGSVTSYPLTFTKAGDYPFHCLIHSTMQGTVHVLASGPLPHTPAFYAQQSISQQNQLLAQGRQVRAAGLSSALNSPAPAVSVGDGKVNSTSTLAVLRFLPGFETIHVGQTVTFTNLDPETPHTVTFGPDPSPGNPFGAMFPIGASGGQATISGPVTSTINSGFMAQGGPFDVVGKTFKVTFLAAGTYNYVCVLHDDLGMKGSIKVVP
jgi:plastocyanin